MVPTPQSYGPGGSSSGQSASMKETAAAVRDTLFEKGSVQNTSIPNPCSVLDNGQKLCIFHPGGGITTTVRRPNKPKPWPVTTEKPATGTLIAVYPRVS